jgi:hypothetical protein
MITNQTILKYVLITSLSLILWSCTSKEEKYSDVIQYAEDFMQIPHDEGGAYQKIFYEYLDPTLPAEMTETWLNGMFIAWGKDPRSTIELIDLKVKREKEVRIIRMKFTLTRISEHRYFDYNISVKQTVKGKSIVDFSALEHKIDPI